MNDDDKVPTFFVYSCAAAAGMLAWQCIKLVAFLALLVYVIWSRLS